MACSLTGSQALDCKYSSGGIREIKVKVHSGSKQIANCNPYDLTRRLWEYILQRAGIKPLSKCNELSSGAVNKLIQVLLYDVYSAKGKTTFKEEFVTCGGVSLKEVDFRTMESKKVKNLFFAGEVLDIDALTGGFNFQAAWTTGFIAGKSVFSSI